MDPIRNQSYARSEAATHDEGLRQYMLGVYNYMSAALALTGIVAYFVSHVPALMSLFYAVNQEGHLAPTMLAWIAIFAPLIMVFYLSARIGHMSVQKAQTMFFIYSGLMGLSMTHIFLIYTGASIFSVFLVTAASFAGLSLYGYTTKKDLSGMGSFMMMGLIGIIIASIVNFFMQSPVMHLVINVLGVIIFAGLTAYDTQAIRRSYYQFADSQEAAARMSIMGALKLYLDFINLFIFLLQFMGDRR
jgi:FtsH-binding integral membrane protein